MRLVDYNIVFLSVQKTGSTAVRDFLEANCKVDKFDNSHYTKLELIDKGLAKHTDTFIATVREPLERQLSRFLYQAKIGVFKDNSIDRFRGVIIDGNGCIPRYKRAVDYGADIWWSYDRLHNQVKQLGIKNFAVLPRVNVTGNLPTDQWMVSQFYDDRTRELATEYHKADTELLAKLF